MSMPTIEPETGVQPEAGGGPEPVMETAAEAQEMLYQAEDKAISLADRVGQVAAKVWAPVERLRQKIVDSLNTPTE